MNVLSLFDGMSCGQIALDQLDIPVDNYYASEIDKWAMQITQKNYPNTIQLGDVTKIDLDALPKIDLLIGGSPCQGFSFAGKQLNFDDPRSKLFFVYVYVLQTLKPKYFLLENVRMKKEYQDVITQYLGVKPIEINSKLVSAQSRNRLYWTNIPNVTQPGDRGIYLRDILEQDATEPMLSNIYGGFKEKQPRVHTDKSVTIRTAAGGGHIPMVALKKFDIPDEYIRMQIRGLLGNSKYKDNFKWNWDTDGRILVTRPDGLKIQRVGRIAFPDTKAEIVTALSQPHTAFRKLSPLECERLQTVPDRYTEGVSNHQRYRMLGNGWTVEVIKHIFKEMING